MDDHCFESHACKCDDQGNVKPVLRQVDIYTECRESQCCYHRLWGKERSYHYSGHSSDPKKENKVSDCL